MATLKITVFFIILLFPLFFLKVLSAELVIILNYRDMGENLISITEMPHLNATENKAGRSYNISFNTSLLGEPQTLKDVYLKSGSSVGFNFGGNITFLAGSSLNNMIDLNLKSLTLSSGSANLASTGYIMAEVRDLTVDDLKINYSNSLGGLIYFQSYGAIYANNLNIQVNDTNKNLNSSLSSELFFYINGGKDFIIKDDVSIYIKNKNQHISNITIGEGGAVNLFQTGAFKILVNNNASFAGNGNHNIEINLKNYKNNFIKGDLILNSLSDANTILMAIKTENNINPNEPEKPLYINGKVLLTANANFLAGNNVLNTVFLNLLNANLALNIKEDISLEAYLRYHVGLIPKVSSHLFLQGSNNVETVIGKNINLKALNLSGLNALVEAKLNIQNGTVKIKGGNLTLWAKGLGAVAEASLPKLDFADSQGANINLKAEDGGKSSLTVQGLVLAGGKVNKIIADENSIFKIAKQDLTVGKMYQASQETVLFLKGTGAVKAANFTFYLQEGKLGDTYLRVENNGSNTDILEVNLPRDGKINLALAGNKLKVGQYLNLINFKNTNLDNTVADLDINFLSSSGIYNGEFYNVIWDLNSKNLILSLSDKAVLNKNGVTGLNTKDIWFDTLDIDNNNLISNSEWATAKHSEISTAFKYYHKLNENAKKLYYNLAYQGDEEIYKWIGEDYLSVEFRQNIENYFTNTVKNITATTGQNRNDLIVNFMSQLEPQMYVSSAYRVVALINRSFSKAQINYLNLQNNKLNVLTEKTAKNKDTWNIWVKTFYTTEFFKSQGFYKGYKNKHKGVYLGLDKNINNLRLGTVFNTSNSQLAYSGSFAEQEIESQFLKIYGEYVYKNFLFGLSFAYGNSDIEGKRYITGLKHVGDYKGQAFLSDVYAAYYIDKDSYGLIPNAFLNYAHIKQDAFTEKGAFPQHFNKQSHNSLKAGLALDLLAPFKLESNMLISPKLSAGLTYQLLNTDEELISRFPGQNGAMVNLKGLEEKKIGLELSLTLNAQISETLNTNLGFYSEHQGKRRSNEINFLLNYSFD